jgi:fumagillin biosynthesis dioxygenase
MPTWIEALDPNDRNIRVFNLLDLDSVFRDLILHPLARAAVSSLLGDDWLISNFTANIALPGSRSMAIHSDQALVVPEPWLAPWALNVIWCLDDVHEGNGATRYLPGSHRWVSVSELPEDARDRTIPFEAAAGSVIVMDGRLWHTSGANTSRDEERALLFAYYTRDFLRPQVNWNAILSPSVLGSLDAELQQRLGTGPSANIRVGASLIQSIFARPRT